MYNILQYFDFFETLYIGVKITKYYSLNHITRRGQLGLIFLLNILVKHLTLLAIVQPMAKEVVFSFHCLATNSGNVHSLLSPHSHIKYL